MHASLELRKDPTAPDTSSAAYRTAFALPSDRIRSTAIRIQSGSGSSGSKGLVDDLVHLRAASLRIETVERDGHCEGHGDLSSRF